MDLVPSMCLCSGMCVSGLPKNEIDTWSHQSASEHAASVEKCKNLRAIGFTVANGSGFQKSAHVLECVMRGCQSM